MKIILITMLACVAVDALCQSRTEKITKEMAFELVKPENTLIVDNINGHVMVEGYDGKNVQVTVEKTITGKTEERLEEGMRDIQLGVIDRADTLILYIKGACMAFGREKNQHRRENGGWGYEWENCNNREERFDYTMNFTIKVPRALNVCVSTINEGNVKISSVTGKVKAFNINGSISLAGMKEVSNANTINGDLNVEFETNPTAAGRFYSLNGDINALFRKGLSSKVSFKSFNGEFYTNLPELVALPVEVEKSSDQKGTKFKVSGNRYQTGKGGAMLDFETFNGNVYLKEQ
jgi:hypothetical protein